MNTKRAILAVGVALAIGLGSAGVFADQTGQPEAATAAPAPSGEADATGMPGMMGGPGTMMGRPCGSGMMRGMGPGCAQGQPMMGRGMQWGPGMMNGMPGYGRGMGMGPGMMGNGTEPQGYMPMMGQGYGPMRQMHGMRMQRYQQVMDRLDNIETRLNRIESALSGAK